MKVLIAYIGLAGVLTTAPARAALPIYGSPFYDSTTATGDRDPLQTLGPGSPVGDGTAIGYADKYVSGTSLGNRVIRWDSTGNAVELGTLGTANDKATYSRAIAVNTAGTAVGVAQKYTAGGVLLGLRPVRWDAVGVAATELGTLGTDIAGVSAGQAYAINSAGTIAGYAEKYVAGIDQGIRAVRWAAGQTAATELGNLGTDGNGMTYAYVIALNGSGAAVGNVEKFVSGVDKGNRAVRWDANQLVATELDNLGTNTSGSTQNYAFAVNADGTTVGTAYKYIGNTSIGSRAVRWDATGTVATELGNLGVSSGTTYSSAGAINATGTAAGYADKYVGGQRLGTRAVRWDTGSTVAIELGNLGTSSSGSTDCTATAINASGLVVGMADKYVFGSDVGSRAVAWGADGVAIDLNTLIDPASGWTLREARGISDTNWVTGIAVYDPDGSGPLDATNRAFLIQIPEPTSMAALAVWVVAALRRRTRR